ncbi:hydroxyisourate hydrolase [Streptomyces griseus]|uniref:5-hydroxyisourate hydrolase n=1 Tax=Streptomyces griseus TaxID=1911 RepID=A0A380P6A5_STRGR|nr:hydroxyisourate hydrolase [Streptomyces griseus]SUP60032.1 Transthyretin protein [Streptomyces griseus]
MSTDTTASVSTHILDTSIGRPAEGVRVTLSARTGAGAPWTELGASRTDGDGRCQDLPAPPAETAHVRLDFDTEAYFAADGTEPKKQAEAQQDAPRVRDSGAFFPEVAITFAVAEGEHYHVPLLLNPFGYSVYRGS